MKKTKKENNKSISKRYKRIIICILLFVVGLLVFFVFITPKISESHDEKDKRDFERTAQHLEQLTNVIKAVPNSQGQWEGGRACSRPSIKYDTSKDASCIVSYSISQRIATLEEAKKLGENYEKKVKSDRLVKMFNYNQSASQRQYFLYDFKFYNTPEKIRCYFSNEYKEEDGAITLITTLDCSGRARDTWFPRSDL